MTTGVHHYAVYGYFQKHPGWHRVREVAETLDLPPYTARPIIEQLCRGDALEAKDDGTGLDALYRLKP